MLFTEDELLVRTLDELLDDLLVVGWDDGTEELLGATLERELLEGWVPLKWVASLEVALMPLALLIR